jgi:hypothetical protein
MMNPNASPQPQGPARSWGTGSTVTVYLASDARYEGNLISSDATGVIIELPSGHGQVFIPYTAISHIERK